MENKKINDWLNAPLINDTNCSFCNYENPKDNFGCDNCGAPLDLEMSFNAFGLPELIAKK